MKIYEVTYITEEITNAFLNLIPQLTKDTSAPAKSELEEIIKTGTTKIFIAEENGILGTLTLVIHNIPTGKKAWIEDVVVDRSARGKGIGEKLLQHAISYASERGIKKIDLTTRPVRTTANKLYQKLGFQKRETNLYRLTISK